MADEHDSIVADWRANAVNDLERNYRFLRRLKMYDDPDEVDAVAHALHADAFRKVDCLRCANCCKTMSPQVTDEDATRIAAHLGMTVEVFTNAYLEKDPEEPGLWMKAVPCSFLGADNRCTIYEVRPADCREFPHTDKDGFIFRSIQHSQNSETCPAAYLIMKKMRQRFGLRERR